MDQAIAYWLRWPDVYGAKALVDHESAWAAAGFKDTELGVWMKLEVRHGTTEVYARVQA